MARINVKVEDFDDGNRPYRSRASSPTTPRRTTRSASKRPAESVDLTERSPRSIKKHKTAVIPIRVQDDKNESDEDDYTSGESSEGTTDDDEKLVKKQLASVQKEQQRKADIMRNEMQMKQCEENRRRERERLERLAKHRKEQEQKLKESEENQRREKEHLERLEKARKEKEAREKKRLEEEDQRKKKLFRQQETLNMYNRVKERMDQERLAKEHKEAEEKRDRRLAAEREERLSKIRQAGVDAAKKLELEEADDEGDDDEDKDEDEESENEEDENESDEDDEPAKKDTRKTKLKEDRKDKDNGGKKNSFLGANAPDLPKAEFCACVRCIRSLATSPLFSCNFTDDPDKCSRCIDRGRSCKPVPNSLHDVVCELLVLQKQYDGADPKSREALRTRVQTEASAIAEKIRIEQSPRRKTQENTYRAILFGQVEIKHNQEEILKLLRSFLPGHSAKEKGSALSDRIAKQKRSA
ncbi:hypothetical protein V498_09264 [Pseudogymnoascus sp. VKM F-4517 (FW-2822)]|nr:hypothetical protein V498_09264 [Pseudogymnoascus sp. VKM F-4517 (FW-2822)]